ncbi:UPF0052-domain-containing protein [Myriangium duriaei CBS 260.36]|uniref:UPF0052-domain-containing protein n=1 Tax=Myriangium duriaei CBS 260.36 TaxID=1168546 RepID=A0A9P4MRV6_9PEZI|nr:UPF0052-domain-containing protein [Myriangium duriaei CBS 260.36]
MAANLKAPMWQPTLTLPNGDSPRPQKGIVVFSGGSAANSLVELFNAIAEQHSSNLSYVIPISDNGGSTSELIRVLGGPGIGDLRSRLVRLIPDSDVPGAEAHAIKLLFNHRLPNDCETARREWLDIVEAKHDLWDHISSPKKELIRSFLITVSLEIVKRLRPTSRFDFSKASIGNLFLTGYVLTNTLTRSPADRGSARLFTGSLESAIYLLSSICAVPSSISVLPAINTNFSHHISAGLADGTTITGQNNISHPSIGLDAVPGYITAFEDSYEESDKIEDANLPGTLPTLRASQINFTKTVNPSLALQTDGAANQPVTASDDLPHRITRLWYISPYGAEIRLPANPRVLSALSSSSAVIYSIGSLYTSLVPSLILRGVGTTIMTTASIRSKILILNGSNDRETGPSRTAFTALDFVQAIADACVQSQGRPHAEPTELRSCVSHVVYMDGPGVPRVDREALAKVGVEAIKTHGRRTSDGEIRYDPDALGGALGMVLGRRTFGDRSRRNTLEH